MRENARIKQPEDSITGVLPCHDANTHLDESVLGALAGKDVAGHLSAHATGEISNVHNFLNFSAPFTRDLTHLHRNEQAERLDVLAARRQRATTEEARVTHAPREICCRSGGRSRRDVAQEWLPSRRERPTQPVCIAVDPVQFPF